MLNLHIFTDMNYSTGTTDLTFFSSNYFESVILELYLRFF